MGAQVDRLLLSLAFASIFYVCGGQRWTPATATFYTGMNSPACAYGNPENWISDAYSSVKGEVITTAVSSKLFQGGRGCGACYVVQCVSADKNWGGGTAGCTTNSVTVVVIDLCPAAGNQQWCGGDKTHFDMSKPAWLQIGKSSILGHLDVQYQRAPCRPTSGGRALNLAVKLGANPNANWRLFIIYYGCGSGTLGGLKVSKDSGDSWISCEHNWGAAWACQGLLGYGDLSFQITNGDGETVTAINALNAGWQNSNAIQDLGTNFRSCSGQTAGGSGGGGNKYNRIPFRKPRPSKRRRGIPGGHCVRGRIAKGKLRGRPCRPRRKASH